MRSSCPPSLDVPTSVWVALVMLHPTPTNLASTTGSAQPSSQAMCTLQLHCNSTHAVGHPDHPTAMGRGAGRWSTTCPVLVLGTQ